MRDRPALQNHQTLQESWEVEPQEKSPWLLCLPSPVSHGGIGSHCSRQKWLGKCPIL